LEENRTGLPFFRSEIAIAPGERDTLRAGRAEPRRDRAGALRRSVQESFIVDVGNRTS
jgi:hypothetical protein